MKTHSLQWRGGAWNRAANVDNSKVQFVVYFGDAESFSAAEPFNGLRALFNNAVIVGASGGGFIEQDSFYEKGLTAAAVEFDNSSISMKSYAISDASESEKLAQKVADDLKTDGLKGVLVIADGLRFNGTLFTRVLTQKLGTNIPIVGGMASDGASFANTFVAANAPPEEKVVAVIGLYGAVNLLYGSDGGWEDFGPERKVTKSAGNILYEIDGKPALDLYKTYLGAEAANLPGSGLLFPLSIFDASAPEAAVTRTIIGIDEAANSLIFAGDIPEGWMAKLMNTDNAGLARGAKSAAEQTGYKQNPNALALLVSCIGRRLFMGPMIDDEVISVFDVLKPATILGFYSNGEICPVLKNGASDLHNQTMTISIMVE